MRTIKLIIVAALVTGAASCQDMDVTNPNNPNRESVLRSPSDIQALVSPTFRIFFNTSEGDDVAIPMSFMADEFSGGFFDFGGLELSQEPRASLNPRSPNSNHSAVFQDYYRILASISTAFRSTESNNLTIREGGADVTQRMFAFGKFMQGVAHGQVGLSFDKGYVTTEDLDFESLTPDQVRAQIRPYTELRDTAISQLKESITISQNNTFTLPATTSEWFPGITMNNQQLARLANTYIARFMAYTPRTPQERAAVNWQQVMTHIDAGITTDFAPVGTTEILSTLYKQRMARQRTTTPSDFARVDYMSVGPADTSAGFITWYNTPAANRQPFRIRTPDRRIDGIATRVRPSNAWQGTPPATCADVPSPTSSTRPTASCGLYTGFHDEVAFFNPGRGTYLRSFYFFHRWGRGTSWESGPIPIITTTEMDLLKAEALIRLGRAAEAIPLINKTRVANGGLPPVDINGAPGTAPNCVPRKLSGACGNLWDALRYEKRIETLGLSAGLQYYDARGWGTLLENTMIQFPMPVVDIELVFGADQIYTFGGGGPGSAPARNWDGCPAGVTVPRC